MHHEIGIKISYSKAYHIKEASHKIVNRTHEDSFKVLPQYCLDIERTNSGSKAILETTLENKFL